MKKNILFVCVENANRSQMAQAFAMMHGKDIVNVHSAGSKPSGIINPRAINAMKEIGYDLMTHHSKSLTEIPQTEYEYVITMGCGDACPHVIARNHEDWVIPDPKEMTEDEFRRVRDIIEAEVIFLLNKLR